MVLTGGGGGRHGSASGCDRGAKEGDERARPRVAKTRAWRRPGCGGYDPGVQREHALSALRDLLPALRQQFGVRRLALFGSTARGAAGEESDLDLLVEFEGGPTFLSFMGLKAHLEDHLGLRIDLVTPDALKPRLRPVIEREAVDVLQG